MIQAAISLRDAIRVEILKQTVGNRSLAEKIETLICQTMLPTFRLKSTFKITYKTSDAQAEELVALLDLYFEVKEIISDLRKRQYLI